MMESIRLTSTNPIFSGKDIDYLATQFSEQYLHKELHHAKLEIHSSLNNDSPELFFWQDYQEALVMAIEIIQSNYLDNTSIPGRIDVNRIKQTNDIVNVVNKYICLKKSGSRWKGSCPFHQDIHPSFFVYPDQQRWYCFSCNKNGDVITFIQEAEQCDFQRALQILGG